MRLVDYLDTGASLGPDQEFLRMGDMALTYGEGQALSYQVARALIAAGVAPGDKVAILSSNHPISYACVFAISRAAAVWCPINPRNAIPENAEVLQGFDCRFLLFHSAYADMVEQMLPNLPMLLKTVCIDAPLPFAPALSDWIADHSSAPVEVAPVDNTVMIAGTGGTTGRPKGVMLSGVTLESMSAGTLIGFPFHGRPTFLAVAPLTHAAGVLCFPIMLLGGRIVVMDTPDLDVLLNLITTERVTHTFLPPTMINMLLDHPGLDTADFGALQCFWYGAAPISVERLRDALRRIGPMAQFFGQTEAPMMVTMAAPEDYYLPGGTIHEKRLASAGRVSPLVRVAILGPDDELVPRGESGEIVVRGTLVMDGYYKNEAATREASVNGWHRTGDIGYLDEDNFLYIVDRAKDMIITGGFNVYSIEVEQALTAHPDVADCAVLGLPDDKWGERIVAVVQPKQGKDPDPNELAAFVKARVGSVKTPKQVHLWQDLPRSKVGKVTKNEIRSKLMAEQAEKET